MKESVHRGPEEIRAWRDLPTRSADRHDPQTSSAPSETAIGTWSPPGCPGIPGSPVEVRISSHLR